MHESAPCTTNCVSFPIKNCAAADTIDGGIGKLFLTLKINLDILWLVVPLLLGGWMIAVSPFAPDLDIYLHLKTGELIWNAKHWLTHDVFTFTAGRQSEEVHSWLAQVVLWKVYEAFSVSGLRVLNAVLVFATGLTLVWRLEKEGLARPLTGATFLVFLLAHQSVQVIRPLLFGEFFFSLISLGFLFRLKEKTPWPYLILSVFLWGNLHGSVLIFLPLLLCYVVCSVRTDCFGFGKAPLWWLAAALAVFLNPSGFSLLTQAAEIGPIGKSAGIWEWLPRMPLGFSEQAMGVSEFLISTEFSDLFILCGLFFGIRALRSAIISRNDESLFEAGRLLLFCLLPLSASRHVVFLILPAALLGLQFRTIGFRKNLLVYSSLTFWLAADLARSPSANDWVPLQNAVAHLKAGHFRGNLLNFPGWGSYLLFRGYPDWKIMADRRLSVNREYYAFENKMIEEDGGLRLDRLLARFPDADAALFHRDADFTPLTRLGWKAVFTQGEVALWMRSDALPSKLARIQP